MLPEVEINHILQKFGPKILQYLKSVGYFDHEGAYQPTDMISRQAMTKYLAASKVKNAAVWAVMEKTLLPELEGTGAAFIEAYGLIDSIPVKKIATDYIKERGGYAIKRMTQTDQKRLTAFIWNDAGQNERVLGPMILKEPNLASLVDGSGARARTIVRTEKGRATRAGSQEFAGNAGATTKTWHTVRDTRVRPTNKNDIGVPGKDHRMLEGKKIKIDAEFEAEGQFPGEKSINCRCWLEYGFNAEVASNPEPDMSTLEELYA